jgi:hypothetical protein
MCAEVEWIKGGRKKRGIFKAKMIVMREFYIQNSKRSKKEVYEKKSKSKKLVYASKWQKENCIPNIWEA